VDEALLVSRSHAANIISCFFFSIVSLFLFLSMIPMRPDILPDVAEQEIDENHARIEAAFHKYIHRADPAETPSSSSSRNDPKHRHQQTLDQQPSLLAPPPQEKHEFEVIVGHGNVIRYFTCRALQIPPEAWLRLSCFNCSITYLMIHPNGYVTCRAFGDMGHLGYDNSTFSGKHGYHWA
jgi:serine/threonine-protein phosphatase PGAM5